MNTIVTSKEAILAECRAIVMEKGISSINMRSVAAACGVAVGSLYNYFPSKADLIGAAVEEVWRDIFHMSGTPFAFQSFTDCAKYPGFFTLHSVSFAAGDKDKGRQIMEHYFGHMKMGLLSVLDQDPDIRQDAFNASLTKEEFIEFIFTAFTSMLLNGKDDLRPLAEIAARCIY